MKFWTNETFGVFYLPLKFYNFLTCPRVNLVISKIWKFTILSLDQKSIILISGLVFFYLLLVPPVCCITFITLTHKMVNMSFFVCIIFIYMSLDKSEFISLIAIHVYKFPMQFTLNSITLFLFILRWDNSASLPSMYMLTYDGYYFVHPIVSLVYFSVCDSLFDKSKQIHSSSSN